MFVSDHSSRHGCVKKLCFCIPARDTHLLLFLWCFSKPSIHVTTLNIKTKKQTNALKRKGTRNVITNKRDSLRTTLMYHSNVSCTTFTVHIVGFTFFKHDTNKPGKMLLCHVQSYYLYRTGLSSVM